MTPMDWGRVEQGCLMPGATFCQRDATMLSALNIYMLAGE
jgi:hypothetical protein